MHKRAEIRNQIYEALKNKRLEVFNQRYYPLQITNKPYSLIYTHSAESEYISSGFPRTRKHILNLTLEIVVSGSDLDNKIDSESSKIESIINAGLGLNISLSSVSVKTNVDGEKPIAVMIQQWTVIYTDNETTP